MSSSENQPASRTHTTEITLVTGDRYRVEGDARDVEVAILDAARGSIMQFAWFVDLETRATLALNPEHVVVLRSPDALSDR